jgi:predicted ATP-dependent endonuclease of OLD family
MSKIINFNISKFKSIENIKVEKIGNLSVIIGKTGAGKSNVADAIEGFFTEIDSQPTRQIGGVISTLWRDYDTTQPIEFIFDIEISQRELSSIMSNIFQQILPDTDQKKQLRDILNKDTTRIIHIYRHLINAQGNMQWGTIELSLRPWVLIKDAKIISFNNQETEKLTPIKDAIPPNLTEIFLNEIVNLLKNLVTTIPAGRDKAMTSQGTFKRDLLMDPAILGKIQAACQVADPPTRKKQYTPFRPKSDSI